MKIFITYKYLILVLLTGLGAFTTLVLTLYSQIETAVTHDGTKTGVRVGYQSYCHPEQGFVIYENEKMPFMTDEGEKVLWTKGDIDCYLSRKNTPPEASPSPKIAAKVKGTSTTNNTQVTNKGKIISYKEYCKGGKEISIYESELITKVGKDGKSYSMTKEDWECYEKSSGNNQNLVDCYIPGHGLYSLTKEECNEAVNLAVATSNIQRATKSYEDTVNGWQTMSDNLKKEGQKFEQNIQNIQPNVKQNTSSNNIPVDNCYKSWDEYFRDHPGSAYTAGLGQSPPCR